MAIEIPEGIPASWPGYYNRAWRDGNFWIGHVVCPEKRGLIDSTFYRIFMLVGKEWVHIGTPNQVRGLTFKEVIREKESDLEKEIRRYGDNVIVYGIYHERDHGAENEENKRILRLLMMMRPHLWEKPYRKAIW